MTSFSRSFALKGASLLLALAAGCGPGDGVRDLERGKEAYAVRNLVKAEKFFTASLDCAPDDVDRLVYLARVKLDLGEIAAAKDLVTRAALNGDGGADVGLLAAQIAWHEKDYKTAAAGFAALADDRHLAPSVRAQAWAGLGVVEMTCDRYHVARVAFLRAIRLDRRAAAAWYHLGLVYQELGYLEMALDQFEIFVRLEVGASPRVQKTQRLIVSLKDAIAHAQTERPGVSNRDSAACSTAIGRAEADWKKGQYRSARQAYQQALAADPISYPAALGLARAWEKTDTTRAGLSKALENYRLACKLRPSGVSTFLTAGALAARLALHAQAVEFYSRAVAASPTSLEAIDGLIRALRKAGDREKAAPAYQLYRDSLSAARR